MTRHPWLLGLALLALAGCKEEIATVGAPAVAISALDLDGAPVRLEDLRGKVVLVNFWTGGCGPCLIEMPGLDAFYRENRDRGFEILALNPDQPEWAVAEIGRRLGVSFPLLVDSLRITAGRYAVAAVPTSFVIDRDGRLVERVIGPLDEAALAAKIGARL